MPVSKAQYSPAGIADRGYNELVDVVIGSVTGIAANGTQTRAAAPFGLGAIDLTDCDFYQPRRRG